jgi:hypothetical protein
MEDISVILHMNETGNVTNRNKLWAGRLISSNLLLAQPHWNLVTLARGYYDASSSKKGFIIS